MSIALSEDLRQALESAGTPLRLVDPVTGETYVVVAEAAYAATVSAPATELADTYPAQIESAMRAGWDDPAMDEYNHYDQHRRPAS